MALTNTIEIFLFINPLGRKSFEAEEMIESFSKEREEKVKVRFIPLLNFRSVKKQLLDEKTNPTSVDHRNKLYTDSFNASLAFAAASMQGKKKARNFLMILQNSIMENRNVLSRNVVMESAQSAKLDLEMFEEDLNSDLAKRAFTKDQKLAQEMAVQDTPACVLFNDSDEEYGYRIDSVISKQLLHGLCSDQALSTEDSDIKTKYRFQTV
ncbi:DsbA family protein [Marinilactibacillus piezotolerans]|uniref:DsbA family protein n=1 Tax=Marinilactibacillus piezotolerans TaxID=258723 RepID=UPI0009B11ADD|nr:DsbA family protein [Marinilactibacillus piezotolerans]